MSYRDKIFELGWRRQDLPAGRDGAPRRWVVLGGGIAQDLAGHLREAGHQADLIPAGAAPVSASETTSLTLGIDPVLTGPIPSTTPELGLAGVVLIAPPRPLDPAAAQRLALDVIRLAAGMPGSPPPRLWLVTVGAVAVRPGEAGEPGLGTLRGLVRVLALERPALRATLVDLGSVTGAGHRADAGLAAALAAGAAGATALAAAGEAAADGVAALAAELIADPPDDEVAWRDGERLVARLARAQPPVPGPRRPVVRPGGAYVITGGYGGLGLLVARWLADRGAARIVLSGRGGPPPAARAAVAGLGARAMVVTGDVAEPGVAERLVAAACDGGVPLRGVVHAAGVFRDALAGDVTEAGLRAVWAPKVAGAWRLHEATAGADLDWFVLFSSAAALLGSPGQAAYAAANAWLDAFAGWRRAAGLPATAVNWGIWADIGAAAGIALGGIGPIGPDEGIAALETLLAELDQVCDRSGLDVCVITRRGNPARELAAVADQFSADALVIGAPGNKWHQLAGSVPGWLARHAQCPVIVVP